MYPTAALVIIGGVACAIVFFLAWRWASRLYTLPCPASLAWALESKIYGRLTGSEVTLKRIGLKPGQRVLEIGPGPGRLLIPAARAILPAGEAFGIEIQPGMVERLQARARLLSANNVTVILGDATQPMVPPESFDVVFLAMTLGEIPDRAAALQQSFLALKAGGVLSITEMLPDPHYQSRATVKRLAEAAGFQLRSIEGNFWLFTANFAKPVADRL